MSLARKWMELEIPLLSKINQIQKDKQHVFSSECGIQILKPNVNVEAGLRWERRKSSGWWRKEEWARESNGGWTRASAYAICTMKLYFTGN